MIDGQRNVMEEVLNTANQLESSSQETSSISEEMASSAQNHITVQMLMLFLNNFDNVDFHASPT